MLAELNVQLEAHFAALARDRAGLGYPVYALEHSLPQEKVDQVKQQLVRLRRLDAQHWLLWVMVATEVGYTYDGDEYWRSFEATITGWRNFGDRDRIRQWFIHFTARFSGFRPSGRWAEHFSIIAWPITHAILPRDLQGQFARHLYDLRYRLAACRDASLAEVGRLLRGDDPDITSRFDHFLQQTELTARLVLALRDQDVEGRVAAIVPNTLGRIVNDLEQRQSARDWLRDARKVLREARLIGPAHSGARTDSPADLGPRETGSRDRSTLVARPDSNGTWHIGVTFPDFALRLGQASIAPAELDGTRLRLRLGTEQWMPGRALFGLSGRDHSIDRLQALTQDQALIGIEPDRHNLRAILTAATSLRSGAPWLLRIHDDGIARQVAGNHVRTGQRYLLLTQEQLPTSAFQGLDATPVAVRPADVHGVRLTIGASLSELALDSLHKLSLGYALRASVAPVGLSPRLEPGSGAWTWLTTEEPMLRLTVDHPVEEFIVTLDRGRSLRVPATASREVFVSLGRLGVGCHVLEVSGTTATTVRCPIEPEQLPIVIRSPEPWMAAIQRTTGFRLLVDPPAARLEELLAGKAQLAIIGPRERPAQVSGRFFNASGHIVEEAALGPIPSLGDAAALNRAIQRLAAQPFAEKLQIAPRVDLAVTVDELGQSSVAFPNKVQPIRWKLERYQGETRLRLVDESGLASPITLESFSIAAPTVKGSADLAAYLEGAAVEPPGALLSAIVGGKCYSVIVAAPSNTRLTSLEGLGTTIRIPDTHSAPRQIPSLLAVWRRWLGAKQTLGPLAEIRRAEVCAAIDQRVGAILCGGEWVARVARCEPGDRSGLELIRRGLGVTTGFSSCLLSTHWGPPMTPDDLRTEFKRLAQRYGVESDGALCDLAFRVAFMPTTIKPSDPDRGASDFERLAATTILVRGAYLARLALKLNPMPARRTEVA